MNVHHFEPVGRRRLIGQLSAFACWAVVTLFGALLSPDPSGHGTHTQLGLPPCPSALLFSRPCPGCGMTTSISALVHGDVAQAFSAHLIGPIAYAAFTLYAFVALARWIRGRSLELGAWSNRGLVVLASAFVVYGGIRAAFTPITDVGPEARYVKRLSR